MNQDTDNIYIERLRSGDRRAFKVLVDRHKDVLYKLAIGMLKEAEDAEDAVQDTFIRAYQKIHQFKYESKFSTWLYRISYNICLMRLRRQKGRPESVSLDQTDQYENDIGKLEDVYSKIEHADRRMYIDKALDMLEIDHRNVLLMYYYQDLGLEEIMAITGWSRTNVKTRLFRARKSMMAALHHILKNEVQALK